MKSFCIFAMGVFVFMGACKVSGEEQGKHQFAHITQDSVGLDLDTGKLTFNDDPVSSEQLAKLLSESYSVSLDAVSFSGQPPAVASSDLLSVLEMMDRAGLDPKRVRLTLVMDPKLKRNEYHLVVLRGDGN